MMLVLSSQRFPYLFFSRMAAFSPSFPGSNEISRRHNVSLYVSLKDPLVRFSAVHMIFVYTLVGSHNSLVFCYRLFPFI